MQKRYPLLHLAGRCLLHCKCTISQLHVSQKVALFEQDIFLDKLNICI